MAKRVGPSSKRHGPTHLTTLSRISFGYIEQGENMWLLFAPQFFFNTSQHTLILFPPQNTHI